MYEKSETEWTKDILEPLIKRGAISARPLVGGILPPSGWEDRLIVARFMTFLVEFKGPRTKVRDDQKVVLKRHHVLNPGGAMVARRMPGYKAGFFQHPVTGQNVGLFKDSDDFLKGMFAVRQVLQSLVEQERGHSFRSLKEKFLQDLGLKEILE